MTKKNNKVAVLPYTDAEKKVISEAAERLNCSFDEAVKRLAVIGFKGVPERDESGESEPTRVKI